MAVKKHPTLETKTVSEARRTFSETLNRVYRGEARVTIEKNGIPVGVLVSPDEIEQLDRLNARRVEQWAAVDRLRQAFADVDPDELDGEIARAASDVRRARKERRASANDPAA
jgi:prevent-host-death family protein